MTEDLRGLVLAGGRSKRMHADKALLDYHGRPQLEWTYGLLSALCRETYVSVRRGQHDPVRDALPRIEDLVDDIGPAAGLLSAHEQAPGAWLVVACDLPFLGESVLRHLAAHRDRDAVATAYRSAHDGLPEPLCAIWEASGFELLRQQVADGVLCPRKTLIRGQATLLEPLHQTALDNINTPEEHAAAVAGFRKHAH